MSESVAPPAVLSRRTWWFALAAIAAVGLVARILYTALLGSDLELGSDATWYALQATIIRSGHGYLDPETFFQTGRAVPSASFPPLWPALLSAVDLVGPSTQTAFQIVGGVVGTVTFVLTFLLGRFTVGLVARILYTVLLGSDLDLGADATWYALQATIIRSGHGYLDPETFFQTGRAVPTASFPPLWPALLSAVDLVGPSTQTAFQIVGGVVGTATVVLTGLLGRAIAGAKAGLGAAAIVALSPAMIAADGSLMSDSLAVALIVAAAVLAVRGGGTRGRVVVRRTRRGLRCGGARSE